MKRRLLVQLLIIYELFQFLYFFNFGKKQLKTEKMVTKELAKEIKSDNHPQFVLNNTVRCRCGGKAIWWKTGYLCETVTARPCKYS